MIGGLKVKSRTAEKVRIGELLNNQRGIALLLTLVVLVLLTAVIVEFDHGARINLITAGNFRDGIQATYLAKAGATAARAVLKDDAKRVESAKYDGLDEFWATPFPPYPVGEGFVSVEITDEAGKIDVNRLADGGTGRDDARAMLRRLFAVLELDADAAETIAQSIEDWVDENDDQGFNGAEDFYYQRLSPPYRCKNGPMDTISELRLVNGVTPEIYRKIRPYLTTVSLKGPNGNGLININTADSPVLRTLYNDITVDTATCIQNGRPYTPPINADSLTGCATSCLTDPACRRRVDGKSGYFTIQAHGIMHETEKIATAMIKREGTKTSFISWQIE